jgi:hypothetical protein
MQLSKFSSFVVFAITFLSALYASAQTVNLWPDVAPGSGNWSYKEKVMGNTPIGTVVFNVTTPTLTAFLPERSKASGTAVIIAPGGAFVALAIDLEGNEAARWLQERGIATFVLKYRIMEKKSEGLPTNMNFDEAAKYGIADGIQAIKIVRRTRRSGASRRTAWDSWASRPEPWLQAELSCKRMVQRARTLWR